MLIDGGSDGTVLRELTEHMDVFDRTLDVMVATHPDLDHIGGLIDVLARYDVEHILMTENEHDTPAATTFNEIVVAEESIVTYADAGQQFSLGEHVEVVIFSPQGDERLWESNNASIIMKVTYGDTSFMLTGDASLEIENHLVGVYGDVLKSDVLKLGHHGSKTSTSELFLDTVAPQYAVVSAGIGNRYGHPHQEVMARVFARNIQSYHTGTDDTVTFESDGISIVVR
jgi:beta-lactamase superfamily II metal-dependent hydrolase